MFDRLSGILSRYNEISARMETPEVYSDPGRFAALDREMRELAPVADKYREYLRNAEMLRDVQMLGDDPELRSLAAEELETLRKDKARLEQELKLLLVPGNPDDDKNVIVEIRGGVGGEESMLFAADLFRMYTMYAEKKGWSIEIANLNETELGGIKEISFLVNGKGAYSRLKFEGGGHRVQRIPVTESGGRIHTSAATVAVLPEAAPVEFELNMNELKIDTFRSSGAGGQHVNKTESAIRVTHLPTGLVVECQDERSQYKNKDRALQIMRSKLYEAEKARQHEQIASDRKRQIGSGDRSDRIRTYNFPQNRVSDHRLTGDIRNFNISAVINGDLDPVIDALTAMEQADRLNRLSEESNEGI